MTAQEKKDFSNEAEKVLKAPELLEVMEEFAGNMGFELKGLPAYGLNKIAFHAAVLARADALGIPISDLKMTSDEAQDQQIDLIKRVSAPPVRT